MPTLRARSTQVLERLLPWAAIASLLLIAATGAVLVRSDGVGHGLFDFSMQRLETGTRSDPPTVLLIGDTGSASPEFRANIRAMEHERPLLAVHTGDVSYHGPKEYRRFLDTVDDLPFPLFAVPGDHDRDWDEDLSEYDELIGGRDRVVDSGDVRIVLLDTSAEVVSDESFSFLEDALAAEPKPKWTIVATHCPPYEPGRAVGRGHAIRDAEQSRRLLATLAAAHVDLLACGHIHGFRDLSDSAVPIVITGGGGRSVEPGDSYHYVRVTLEHPIRVVEVVTSGPRGRAPLERLLDSVIALLLWNGKSLSIGALAIVALLAAFRWRAALSRFPHVLAAAPLAFALVSTRWEWENEAAIWTIASVLTAAAILLRSWPLRGLDHVGGGAPAGPRARALQPHHFASLLSIAAAVVASELIWLLPIALAWAVGVFVWASMLDERRLSPPATAATPAVPLHVVLRGQILYVLVLAPFLFKELNPFGFWPIH